MTDPRGQAEQTDAGTVDVEALADAQFDAIHKALCVKRIIHPDDDHDELIEWIQAAIAAAEAAAGERIAHGIRFNIEVACDGYAHLMDEDVPGGVYDMTSYQQGAHDAAEGIRSVLPARVARPDAAAEQGGA